MIFKTTQDKQTRWRNISDAAKWLAEGKSLQIRPAGLGVEWADLPEGHGEQLGLFMQNEYRVKPEPPKPSEFLIWVDEYGKVQGEAPKNHAGWKLIHVREVMKTDG